MNDKSEQPRLFYEDVSDVLRAIVQALGGAKKVGPLLRGKDLTIEASGRWVLDCLNAERRERFAPEHVVCLLAEARRIDFHAGMHFLCQEAGYEQAKPIEPEDERAKAQREFVEAVQMMSRVAERMERLGVSTQGPATVSSIR